ncbi:MAG TPA: cysteine hydrolase [Nitrososphaeraceae archaeon]|jgi:ureidoacrylate peracid hydrolase|nr:cysteine hydrolase [Nitrososphaeraceae archaeon]
MKSDGMTYNPALLVVDVQNGFMSKGGSYDLLGMKVSNYQQIIPKLKELISICKKYNVPIFYTQAVRESSGIDLLTKTHRILPKSREERIKKRPICVRGTWDAKIVDEVKPTNKDHVVIKRRDSAFQDTETEVWLNSLKVNTLIFCGIDTSICVETSLRDGFNKGYDVMLISDATASANIRHYKTTIEHVKEYYGLVMKVKEIKEVLEAKKNGMYLDKIKMIREKQNLLEPDPN